MRIMLDTNVLISMIFFPSNSFFQLMKIISEAHTLVLSSFVIDELFFIAEKKFPTKKDALDLFLSRLSYEFVYTPHKMRPNVFRIRDINDYPVLYTAVIENVDILITGDNDFIEVAVERPVIMTPREFLQRYGK
ncbi:putative toxin-antitoxin system toxin component, PIN family [Treponema socranskii]